MKHLLMSLALLVACSLIAAVPEGGVPAIQENAIASLRAESQTEHATLTRVKVEGQPFAEAIRCDIRTQPERPWAVQFQFRTTRRIEKGEVLWMRFFARTLESRTENGEGQVHAIFEKAGPPHDKSLSCGVTLGRTWQEYFLPFKSREAYEAGRASAGFHLGVMAQCVEIADVALYAFGTGYDLARLPRTRISYAGQALDAPWRTAAAARIEQHRKADLAVRVTDSTGRPVPGAKVAVEMRRHAFGWGSAVTVKGILRQDADGEKYRAVIEKNFSRVVFENDLKWNNWDKPDHQASVLRALDWLRERRIDVRGHCLVWPSWRHTPRDLQTHKDDPEKLRARINAHIAHEVSILKGRLIDWDVINEPYTNHDLMKVLGDEEMIAWFKLARRYDPEVNLYLNDYAILSGGGLDRAHQDHFEKTLRFLKQGGAPINGLGMQAHFGGTPTPPERMLKILDRFAALGLAISITEHDIDTQDEQLQADFTRDFLTVVFSHPAVVALLTWGFWEDSHWRPNAAYYRSDWSLKPAGQVWLDLVTRTWWTNETLTSGADGTARTRGFLGDYVITVMRDGKTVSRPVTLTNSGCNLTVAIP